MKLRNLKLDVSSIGSQKKSDRFERISFRKLLEVWFYINGPSKLAAPISSKQDLALNPVLNKQIIPFFARMYHS